MGARKIIMTLESSIQQFSQTTRRPFRWERFYDSSTGNKMWQASCQFEVRIGIDPKLDDLLKMNIEYRQFIRGGVWVRRGNEAWTSDTDPNGNKFFPIPPYSGQSKVAGIPTSAVSGTGLSLSWKEDGQIENGGTERYGYRDTASVNAANEIDLWQTPTQITGRNYLLRDTPSIAGEWGVGESVEVWIELYFKGFVVEVERDSVTNQTKPVKILKQKDWSYSWTDKKLSLWMDAAPI
ncbi:MAG: hypothetical protein AB7W44_02305 [Pyrinomonadaceae bacterium]